MDLVFHRLRLVTGNLDKIDGEIEQLLSNFTNHEKNNYCWEWFYSIQL